MANALRLAAVGGLAAFLAAQAVPAANARIVVQEKISYYPISGRTGVELGKAMIAGGPRAIHMRHAIAATATRFDFLDPKFVTEKGRCAVKDLTVKLTITYHYPKWGNEGSGSAPLRRAWRAFYDELKRHEQTHGRIARKYASRVEREMKRMSGTVAFGCNDFGNWTQIRMKALSARLKEEQAAFDRLEDRKASKISRLQTSLLQSR